MSSARVIYPPSGARAARPSSEKTMTTKSHERKLKNIMILETNRNEGYSMCAGVVTVLFTYALTTTVIALGVVYKIQDLYIVGGILGLCALLLTVMLTVKLGKALCRGRSIYNHQHEMVAMETQVNRDVTMRF